MVGIYFSGTGNSRYALDVFLQKYNADSKSFSIEDNNVIEQIKEHDEIIISYPVQYSTVPKILRDFIIYNHEIWSNKKIFIIATMGLFSGDGAGILARILQKYGAEIIGGLHLKMPDNIGDVKALKRPLDKNIWLVKKAVEKITVAVENTKAGKPPQEGIGVIYQMTGLIGQRCWFGRKTQNYSDKLKIAFQKCVGCGKCVKLCPMKNIELINGRAVSGNQCTMCYRCINYCPKQAITLLGKEVIEQSVIEKYL